MPVQEDLAVQHHQQDTDYYCGAACAQMVLETIGAGILDQDDLYADNHSHSTIEPLWYTGPDGLTWTMNDRRPASFANWFVLFALAGEDAISRKIVWTIHHYQVAPIALVYGWAHWIVVRGYDASAAPSGAADTSYTITAFDINNPWPPTPSGVGVPPHAAADGCGSGGTRGIANEHVTYATWQADYMTGVPSGHWAGKFLAVCDPEPPAERRGPSRGRDQRLPGDHLLRTDEAARRAAAGLKQYGLHERKSWRAALRDAKPLEPMLVQRLDRRDTYYYIVPMGPGRRRASAAVSVDARFGDYRQAVALPREGGEILAPIDREAALKRVLGRRFDLGEGRGRIPVRDRLFCLYPTLVWKPCLESLSPFYPFYMLTLGADRLYVRIDGEVFTTLHDDVRGI
jgi:hypothetical protein